MKGFLPDPPPRPLTQHTREFVALVRTCADAAGRPGWTRADWLRTLLTADYPPYLSTILLHQSGADLSALAAAVSAAERRSDAWLGEPVPEFVVREADGAARELGHWYIGTEHFLFVFARAPGLLGDQLREAGLTWDRVRAAFDAIEWR
jgi:hypothetical protein